MMEEGEKTWVKKRTATEGRVNYYSFRLARNYNGVKTKKGTRVTPFPLGSFQRKVGEEAIVLQSKKR